MNLYDDTSVRGMIVRKSRYYRGRYCCLFYGPIGTKIKKWIRAQFLEDDMVYADDITAGEYCMALITEQQLMIVKLRWL